MVLRGSQIAPPSLKEAEERLRQAREALNKAKDELREAQRESLSEIVETDTVAQLSKRELIEKVKALQAELQEKQQKEISAQIMTEKARSELVRTLQQLACGGAAGAIARTTVAPIDRVKILMQTSHLTGTESSHRSILSSMRHVIANEGLSQLWRGNLTNCVRVIPHTATQFVAYDKYKNLIVGDGEITIPKRLMSGALSGMTAATVTHPLDVVRIRLQTQPELRGVGDAIRSVYREGGMRTFYKGYTPAMLSLSPFIAINFATMDTLKKLYFGADDSKLSKKELKSRNPFSILFLGACSGIIAQTFCYPLDTVRRRMQLAGKNYASTANAFTTIVSQEGFRGFYKGMSANALKVVPNNAIRFAAFDVLKSFLLTTDNTKVRELEKKRSSIRK